MGRHSVEITLNDLHLYSTCKFCKITLLRDGINRARLIQDYNRHINSSRHKLIMQSNEPENDDRDLKIQVGELNNQIKLLHKLIENQDKKIVKLNNVVATMQTIVDRRNIIINPTQVYQEEVIKPVVVEVVKPVDSKATVKAVEVVESNSDDDDDDDDRTSINYYDDDDLREKYQTKDSYELIETDSDNFYNFKELLLHKSEKNNDRIADICSEIENIILWFDDLDMSGVDKKEAKRIKQELQSIRDIIDECDNNYDEVDFSKKELDDLYQSLMRISKNIYSKININNKWIKI